MRVFEKFLKYILVVGSWVEGFIIQIQIFCRSAAELLIKYVNIVGKVFNLSATVWSYIYLYISHLLNLTHWLPTTQPVMLKVWTILLTLLQICMDYRDLFMRIPYQIVVSSGLNISMHCVYIDIEK